METREEGTEKSTQVTPTAARCKSSEGRTSRHVIYTGGHVLLMRATRSKRVWTIYGRRLRFLPWFSSASTARTKRRMRDFTRTRDAEKHVAEEQARPTEYRRLTPQGLRTSGMELPSQEYEVQLRAELKLVQPRNRWREKSGPGPYRRAEEAAVALAKGIMHAILAAKGSAQ